MGRGDAESWDAADDASSGRPALTAISTAAAHGGRSRNGVAAHCCQGRADRRRGPRGVATLELQ